MEVSWRNRGENMETLWRIHNCGETVENLWGFDGSFVEKILDWNVEKLWNICGE